MARKWVSHKDNVDTAGDTVSWDIGTLDGWSIKVDSTLSTSPGVDYYFQSSTDGVNWSTVIYQAGVVGTYTASGAGGTAIGTGGTVTDASGNVVEYHFNRGNPNFGAVVNAQYFKFVFDSEDTGDGATIQVDLTGHSN